MAEKRIPERLCLGCNKMKPKNSLIRVVKNEEGIFIDATGKKNGRGAYVCDDPACIAMLVKKKGLDRAFKEHVSENAYKEVQEAYNRLHG